ncbi:hypothetical protein IX39_10325 [Chryseobacterium formosense]|uniref:TonB C-terminal domain-containing protein n=1 Tax=Chryseobacterium formosense TaxID=236814 RepID=A0A085Z977_9FLAO|nr:MULTISPECIES: hypothetical protein [Chryseobacterium]KFF00991.1 hypothetical protein IX39_10325 [Chryseobacterium formosense]OCK50222.1 hypothetical protein BA768_06230 [Chryseobacterium sp. CBo1]SFT40501.1 hypothetical protein SAMN05421857_0760 [Chryseobacterium formosense]
MKNKIQIFVTALFIFGLTAVVNNAKAQTTSSNTIQEIQLNKNDAFNEIRNLLMANFDFTNSDYKQGVVNSEVKFDIAENGKIVNVRSKGDCKNVSKEIVNVLSHLQYKIDPAKLNENMLASSYVMPVKVDINNR